MPKMVRARPVATWLELSDRVSTAKIMETAAPAIAADVVSARALAPLVELLPLAQRFMTDRTICLFLKGQQAEADIAQQSLRILKPNIDD